MTERAFPWEEAMAFCLGVLRWSPDAFWRATPRELIAAMQGPEQRGAPATADDLQRLMQAFPDTEMHNGE